MSRQKKTRRNLRAAIKRLKALIARQELQASYYETGRPYNLIYWSRGERRGVLSWYGQRLMMARALRINGYRLKSLKRAAAELRPDRQESRPRVKHDRRG